ncbi:MAG: hypothetical protein ACP6IQ_02710 [Candidatus Njordarchaeia archaeon]
MNISRVSCITKRIRIIQISLIFVLIISGSLLVYLSLEEIKRNKRIENLNKSYINKSAKILIYTDRSVKYLLFDIPCKDSYGKLSVKLNITLSISNVSTILVQFSYDNRSWHNLKLIKNVNRSNIYSQPIDNSWAIEGIIFLRAIAQGETSNICVILIKTNYFCFHALFYLFIITIISAPITFAGNLNISFKKAIIIGFIIRITFAPISEQRFDMGIIRFNSFDLLDKFNLIHPKDLDYYPPNYPKWIYGPLFLLYSSFILLMLNLFFGYFGPIETYFIYPTDFYREFLGNLLPIYDLLIKLPVIISDLVIARKLYEYLQEEYKSLIVTYWLLNPYSIMLSGILGMLDPVATLMFLLAVLFFTENKIKESAVFFALGYGIKLYPLLFSILLLFILPFLFKDSTFHIALKYLTYIVLFTLIMILVQYFCFGYKHLLLISEILNSRLYDKLWIGGLSFFSILNSVLIGEYISILSYIFGVFVFIFLLFLIYRLKEYEEKMLIVVIYIIVVLLTIYLFSPHLASQYMCWSLPFLIILIWLGRNIEDNWLQILLKIELISISVMPLLNFFFVRNIFYYVSPALLQNEYSLVMWSDLEFQKVLLFSGFFLLIIRIILFLTNILLLIYLLNLLRYLKTKLNGKRNII